MNFIVFIYASSATARAFTKSKFVIQHPDLVPFYNRKAILRKKRLYVELGVTIRLLVSITPENHRLLNQRRWLSRPSALLGRSRNQQNMRG
jgi:hypothetical protein